MKLPFKTNSELAAKEERKKKLSICLCALEKSIKANRKRDK